MYPVSEVTRYLRELLEHDRHLTNIWVSGEISNLNVASSGHAYFTLKDERGALRCAFFRNRNAGQRDRLANGASYLVYGSLSLYEVRGEISFVVEFVFAIPGMGRFFITAVTDRDYPLIMGVTLVYTALLVCANLVVDLLYSFVDPRIRVE